jgi:hypothetical protein
LTRFRYSAKSKYCRVSQENHSTTNLAPLFRRGWRPLPIRKELSNVQSGWFCQRDKSPIAMISDWRTVLYDDGKVGMFNHATPKSRRDCGCRAN